MNLWLTKGNENQPLPASPLTKGEESCSPSLFKEGARGSCGGFEKVFSGKNLTLICELIY
jgi:hypothetical protein